MVTTLYNIDRSLPAPSKRRSAVYETLPDVPIHALRALEYFPAFLAVPGESPL